MATLLTLPRELRDIIISHVLLEIRHAPLDDTDNSISRAQIDDVDYLSWGNSTGILSETKVADPPATALLMTNHQIHQETLDALAQLPGKGKSYKMDVLFVKGEWLLPTWTQIPCFARNLDTVEVTFRSVGASNPRSYMWRGGDGGPPRVVWLFYSLLERSLKAGPVGETGSSGKTKMTGHVDREITIKNLVLKFSRQTTATEEFAEQEPPEESNGATSRDILHQNRRTQHLRPKWLAEYVLQEISFLLGLGYYMARYGAILYERIGSITVQTEDSILAQLDLSSMLATEKFVNNFGFLPFEERESYFDKWMQDTIRRRRIAGFPPSGSAPGEENGAERS